MRAEWKLDDGHLDVKFWVSPTSLDETCWEQIRNLKRLPFAVQHIAVMPDAHCGYGMPIGCILATDNVVIPNAVGVDIGCGMIAVRLAGLPVGHVHAMRQNLVALIEQAVPVGRNWHDEMCRDNEMPDSRLRGQVVSKQYDRARHQLGTLGSGNHFIEIQVDEHGDIWVMIHSGSRNLGKQVCDFYNKWAREENALHFSSVPPSSDLAFFRRSHDGFDQYIQEMNYCIEFARKNRERMMWAVLEAFRVIWPDTRVSGKDWFGICHNHMSIENHFGRNVCVHRKGAAGPYRSGKIGIIPGSMGSKSFLVSHTGEPMSYLSTSHGAGRRMSRKKAKEDLNLKDQQAILDDMDVVHGLQGRGNLDEAPGAYKSIDEVMANQVDLCNIETVLKPILSIKG